MNNKKFWTRYNDDVEKRVLELIEAKERDGEGFALCDFHMHSNHSSDGKQSVEDIINESIKYGFEIISITDHDCVSAYDELYKLLKKGLLPEKAPIIIPGIEHTVSFREYRTMCHIVKYFINLKSKDVNHDIKKLNASYYNRVKIQLDRILKSEFYQSIFQTYRIRVGYKDFLRYLKQRHEIPDYAPLVDYLAIKFHDAGLKTAELYRLVREFNDKDPCVERRQMKLERFAYLDNKYQNIDVQDNRRFMLSILGVRGVDDAYFPGYPISGSLSVDEYGQVSIYDLNHDGVTVFAHPEHDRVHLIENVKECAGGFWGLELNFKSKQEFFGELIAEAKKQNLHITCGSDRHAKTEPVYENLDFYRINIYDLKSFIDEKHKKG